MQKDDFIDIFNESPSGIIILNKNLEIINLNKEAYRLTGLDPNSPINKRINSFVFRQQNNTNATQKLLNCIKQKKEIKNNLYIETENNSTLIFIQTKYLTFKDNEVVILSLTDISSIIECDYNIDKNKKINYLEKTIIGKDEKTYSLYRMIELASESMANVLITGESGTGKELVAKAIHSLSDRNSKSFVVVNCSALSETLLESELFGHLKGSFTGAYKNKIGKFESAEGGTIFLDEIGDISPALQLKLLRVIQEKTIMKVGDVHEIKVDMRIITATNKNLRSLVNNEEFREDLFYRLNVFTINTIPLREKSADIPVLANYFIKKYNSETGKQIKELSDNASRLFLDYCWPGNIRELENAIEHAFVLCNNDMIDIFDLPQELRQTTLRQSICKEDKNAEQTENSNNKPKITTSRKELLELLNSNKWNKAKTARDLGISRVALWKRLKKHGINS